MPRIKKYEKIEKKFIFEDTIRIGSNSSSTINLPFKLAKELENKKVIVILEVVED